MSEQTIIYLLRLREKKSFLILFLKFELILDEQEIIISPVELHIFVRLEEDHQKQKTKRKLKASVLKKDLLGGRHTLFQLEFVDLCMCVCETLAGKKHAWLPSSVINKHNLNVKFWIVCKVLQTERQLFR